MNSLRMRARLTLCAAAMLVAAGHTHARDLPKSDPDRLAILDAARGTESIKFVVKDLFKAGDYAFLCALKQGADGGGIYRTDESYEVYHYLFVKEPAGWVTLLGNGEFVTNPRRALCAPATAADAKRRPVGSQEDVQRLFVAILEDRVRRGLDFGKVDEEVENLLRILGRRKVPTPIRIEGRKQPIDDTYVSIAVKSCPTDACRKATQESYERLRSRQGDPKISSLVWNACQFGRRRFDLTVIDRCVSDMAPRRHCRPSMDYLVDRADIQACVADMRALCQATMGKDCAL